ncbi:multicopper oxidase family protein [Actinomadura opuntiae]|uniref:multicopper oxidase family protein n=1 Tax=Actinomadura sp. OS1-43 TaxID=604315 RepID=UPI00255AE61E|nr:multicopper oxidase domain-containing protein [Actinomadura sp. OS1-43]MDL4813645.1 multicopper oxidase domain-containing protein [Actinomadura sp. OS1-43]
MAGIVGILGRRAVLGLVAGGLAGRVVGGAASGASGAGRARVPPPFSVPMAVPVEARPVRSTRDADHYRLVAAPAVAEILPGVRTPVLAYNGAFPGPTIRARAGRRVVVEHVNHLGEPTTVHLHGGEVSPEDDGGPMDLVEPGRGRRYHYANGQRAATLWYHDHAHHLESEHVYRGLAGAYLLHDECEVGLGLPSGRFDVPIVLRDARFGDDGSLVYIPEDFRGRNTILVNGRPQPYFRVAARKYRFRVLNAANMRFFKVELSTGDHFLQIATDRGLMRAPLTTTSVPLSPGERADIVVDFSRYAPGQRVVLRDGFSTRPSTDGILRFDVCGRVRDCSRVPERLAILPALRPATADREFRLSMDKKTGMGFINGRAYDSGRIDFTVERGAVETWRIVNENQVIQHNFHVHLADFRVLDRNGGPPMPTEDGLKDTVMVRPGESVGVRVAFHPAYTGDYIYHCHIVDHSAMGMMGQFRIAGRG